MRATLPRRDDFDDLIAEEAIVYEREKGVIARLTGNGLVARTPRHFLDFTTVRPRS
jgi:hypothetical protein